MRSNPDEFLFPRSCARALDHILINKTVSEFKIDGFFPTSVAK